MFLNVIRICSPTSALIIGPVAAKGKHRHTWKETINTNDPVSNLESVCHLMEPNGTLLLFFRAYWTVWHHVLLFATATQQDLRSAEYIVNKELLLLSVILTLIDKKHLPKQTSK